METTSNDNHVIQHQNAIRNKQIDVNENRIKELYNLGFNNGREEFMSDSQLNMIVLPLSKLNKIKEIEKNEEVYNFLKSQREKNLIKLQKDIWKANEIYKLCQDIIDSNNSNKLSQTELLSFDNDNIENSINILNDNMNVGRSLIELCIAPYEHLKSFDFQKDSFYYKLGYSIGLYTETMMFYGSVE